MKTWTVVILAACYGLAFCCGLVGCQSEVEPAAESYSIDLWRPDSLAPDSIYISLTVADSFGCPQCPTLIYFCADSIICPLVLRSGDTYNVFILEPGTELRVFESIDAYERWARKEPHDHS